MADAAAGEGPLSVMHGPKMRSGIVLYAAALAIPVVTLLLRLAFWQIVPGLPFVAFIPGVALLATLGATGPAILATLVSAGLGLAYLSVPWPFGPGSQPIWIGLATYLMVCAIVIVSTRKAASATTRWAKLEAAQAAEREMALRDKLNAAEAASAKGQAERRLELVTDALPVLISHVGADLRYQFVNKAYEDWFGLTREKLVGRTLGEVLGEEVVARIRPCLDAVLSGQPASFEERIRHVSGERRDVLAHYVPNIGHDGKVEGYFALVRDVTEAKQQADLLAQRERHISAVLESVTDCFYAVDADWRITLVNRAAENFFGRDRDELMNQTLWDCFPSLLGTEFEHELRRVMERREPASFEAKSKLHPGRYIEMRVAPKDGSGLAVAFSDITRRKLEEHQRELLVNELNHRVKNTLAVVQSMAVQSLPTPPVPRELKATFEGRLQALAAAHDLLTSESWEAAQLRRVVEVALTPFDVVQRFSISGPDLRIRPQAAVSLTLAIHELATNATKYGALSDGTGRVRVDWSITGGSSPTVCLVWREQGGPAVRTPSKRGFGSRLIERGLAREVEGTVELEFRDDGLLCMVKAPVASLQVH